MSYGLTLIDKAAKRCGGSRYALSQATGIPQSTLSAVVNGKRSFPLSWCLRLATIAGVDPGEALRKLDAERRNKTLRPSLKSVRFRRRKAPH